VPRLSTSSSSRSPSSAEKEADSPSGDAWIEPSGPLQGVFGMVWFFWHRGGRDNRPHSSFDAFYAIPYPGKPAPRFLNNDRTLD